MAGYTTIVALAITQSIVCGGSSGDSAAVVLQENRPALVLTENQHKNPPIGSGGAIPVPFHAKLEDQWMLLAMSDGVWKYVGWENILLMAQESSGRELAADLLDRARLRPSGKLQDDFTLVVMQYLQDG